MHYGGTPTRIGVCVPASEHPSPPQQSSGETAFIPDGTGGIAFVN
jgi:hypothetical protein